MDLFAAEKFLDTDGRIGHREPDRCPVSEEAARDEAEAEAGESQTARLGFRWPVNFVLWIILKG